MRGSAKAAVEEAGERHRAAWVNRLLCSTGMMWACSLPYRVLSTKGWRRQSRKGDLQIIAAPLWHPLGDTEQFHARKGSSEESRPLTPRSSARLSQLMKGSVAMKNTFLFHLRFPKIVLTLVASHAAAPRGEPLAERALGKVTAGPGAGETPALAARRQRSRGKFGSAQLKLSTTAKRETAGSSQAKPSRRSRGKCEQAIRSSCSET